MRLIVALSVCLSIVLLSGAVAPLDANASSAASANGCKTTPPSATVAMWAKSYGIAKLSGNGKIYVALPTWPANRVDGVLHHKMPWLFAPTFKPTAHVSFRVYNAAGARAGTLTSGSAIVLGSGGSGPAPTSLDVPTRGCYRVVAQAGATVYRAWIRVY